jgi:hypothetical protein
MRCTACGYISFDYLDRCQKCSTDLTRERMSLNLPAARPDPISVKTIIDRVAASRAGESRSQEKEKTRIKPPASLEEAMPEIDLTRDPADDPLATLRKQAKSINVEGLRRKSDPVEISLDDLEMEQAFKKNPLA